MKTFTEGPSVQCFHGNAIAEMLPPAMTTSTPPPESIRYETFDGRHAQGWLYRNTATPNGRVAVLCHGGPTYAVVNECAGKLVDLLLAQGYHVFQPNFRGSVTFGVEWRDLNIGDPGGGDLQDVLFGGRAACRAVGSTKRPIILGESYGGYLTLLALTQQSEDWEGGIAIVPIVDQTYAYALYDAHYRRFTELLFDGTPDEKSALYRDRSPITHLEGLDAPVLIVSGRHDPATPFAPVEAFAAKAEALGKDLEFVPVDTGHGVSDPEELRRVIERAVAMLQKLAARP